MTPARGKRKKVVIHCWSLWKNLDKNGFNWSSDRDKEVAKIVDSFLPFKRSRFKKFKVTIEEVDQ